MATLIFDLDDTLIESFPTYARMHQEIAADLGWRVPSVRELVAYGNTWEETLRSLWPQQDLAPFLARYEVVADTYPYPAVPGAIEALNALRADHELWIVTKRSRKRLAQRMTQAQLDMSWFRGIYAVEDQAHPKPDPRCFQPVWDARGGRPDGEVFYVGDREDDAHAAVGAAVPFIAVLTGPESGDGFPPAGVPTHAVLPSVAELPRLMV